MATEKMVDRIAALLRLAGNNPEQHEAEAAAEKAAELMAKHNITMAQVAQAQASESSAHRLHADCVTIDCDTAQMWRVDLANVVARSMDGRVVYAENRGSKKVRVLDTDPRSKWFGRYVNTDEDNPNFRLGKLHFIGTADSLEGMVALYTYLEFQLPGLLNKAFKARIKEAEELGLRKPHGRTFRTSYMPGMILGLNERLRAMRARVEAEMDSGNALVLLRDVVDEKMRELFPHTVSKKASRSIKDHAAYQRGVSDAGRVDMKQPKVGGIPRPALGR